VNQPKFKFGDTVYCESCEPFIVYKIEWNKHYQQYEYNLSVLEDMLSLYEEPQPKKLLAYCNPLNEEIIFRRKDIEIRGGILERAPEYDLEYPEK
jgi:hypothetical protein